MRISDWSSDVCSSDLLRVQEALVAAAFVQRLLRRFGHAQPHQSQRDDAHDVHIVMRTGADVVRVRHTILHEPHRRGLEFAIGLFEAGGEIGERSEEHTSELQSLMRISYAVFCLKKKKNIQTSQQYDN